MPQIAGLQRQHAELLELCKTFRSLLDDDLTLKAAELRSTISKTAGVLRLHLAMEDEVFYPELKQSDSQPIKEATELLSAEMLQLRERFADFLSRWATTSAIAAAPEAFKEAALTLLDILEARIALEESQIFTRVHDTGDAPTQSE